MTSERSRRIFLKYFPGAAFLMLAAISRTYALHLPAQNPTVNPGNNGQTTPAHPPMGGGYGGGGMGPSPARQNGDTQPQTITPPDPKKGDPAPRKPRKNLAANQRDLRAEVQQLVRDSQELKKAVEQFGPNRLSSPDMVAKTKEVEKLAHSIAALAKG
jgi:hypothetical protein